MDGGHGGSVDVSHFALQGLLPSPTNKGSSPTKKPHQIDDKLMVGKELTDVNCK